MTRILLFGLLAVVAMAAAVLSFAALDELGALCGFGPLSALLPVVVDAAAAAGSVAWLSRTAGRAGVFGRALALVLLAGSVVGNALSHGLTAYVLTAPWWVVVAVSAVPPAVLGAVVHLATLTAQDRTGAPVMAVNGCGEGAGGLAPGAEEVSKPVHARPAENIPTSTSSPSAVHPTSDRRTADLIADGAGRRRLAKELGISEYEARSLLGDRRNSNGAAS